jgi:hypothetical protein
VVIPFTQAPVLDYQVIPASDKEGHQRFNVIIHNFGNVGAQNVILSMKATNAEFVGFKSYPYLGHYFVSYNGTDQTGL